MQIGSILRWLSDMRLKLDFYRCISLQKLRPLKLKQLKKFQSGFVNHVKCIEPTLKEKIEGEVNEQI